MPKVYGFVGVIGSGKNYQQAKLVQEGWVAIDFKDELIDMCADLVGYNIREDYDGFKEYIVGFQKQHRNTDNMLVELTDKQYKEYNEGCIDVMPFAMTGRRMLQRMGTEVMRKRDPDYWVNAWHKKAVAALWEGKNVAVADVRFHNEIEAILNLQYQSFANVETKIIFCDYYSDRYCSTSTHESEKMAQEFKRMEFQDQQEIPFVNAGSSSQIIGKWKVSK